MKKSNGSRDSRAAPRSASGLSELETEIMLVLWAEGESTVARVRERLATSRSLAHTTVITVLDRMCAKGVVRKVAGQARPKRYLPVLERELVADRLLGSLKKRFFDGSSASLFAHLLDAGEVDAEELAEIRKLLNDS